VPSGAHSLIELDKASSCGIEKCRPFRVGPDNRGAEYRGAMARPLSRPALIAPDGIQANHRLLARASAADTDRIRDDMAGALD
ncbi:hypothetical protein, partial [Methylobacterium nigriterrae]|uniref:hypothetical protein n=1 Tax=Methylobacterium nigriterrae TaxID=3127512 RepID=UPI003013DF47